MVKKLLLILGIIVCLFALVPLVQYVFDYQQLSEYGQGFIWGKVLLLVLGGLLIFASLYTRKTVK